MMKKYPVIQHWNILALLYRSGVINFEHKSISILSGNLQKDMLWKKNDKIA